MNRLLKLTLCGVIGLMATPSFADDLNVAVTTSSVPFSYKNEAGQQVGFNVDMAKEICKRIKATCKLHAIRYPDILGKVNAGEIDFALPNMLKTPAREEKAAFSIPYWRSTSSFVGPVDYSFGDVDKVLAREKVCAIAKTRQKSYLEQKMSGNTERLIVTKTSMETIKSMQKGVCKIYLMPTMQSLSFLQSDDGHGFGYLGKPIANKGLGGEVHMIVRPDNPDLLKQVDKAMRSIIEDGTHTKITSQYFPFRIL
ncbi:transporter substrate-binding domain-containing protein [Terasakiella sp. A23]|uniref:substrate-binding periplasmic protein n=1 Tax=Terasakiella sp. FCG-A23 TaxID=3080561 RepID=UPI0029534815|nr:transporter substrate-binding domain-containing protein [Terasakiella sp. A23]MDV7340410.1 transporter substrate-binding domain-containing protein [Terasakiella sp. A23]